MRKPSTHQNNKSLYLFITLPILYVWENLRKNLLFQSFDIKEVKPIAWAYFEASLAPCEYLPHLDTNTTKKILVPSILVVCLSYFGIAECLLVHRIWITDSGNLCEDPEWGHAHHAPNVEPRMGKGKGIYIWQSHLWNGNGRRFSKKF